jgi:hypothetical protein
MCLPLKTTLHPHYSLQRTVFPTRTMLIVSSNLSLALPNGYSPEDFIQNISDGFFISSCVLHRSFILSRKHKCKNEGIFLVVSIINHRAMPNAGMQVSPIAHPILNLRSSLFWDFMQRILVVSYSFGTTYRSRNFGNYQHTFVILQKSEDLIYTAEEA